VSGEHKAPAALFPE